MKRRITFVNPIGGIGGAERVLLALVRQLRTTDTYLSAILFSDGPLKDELGHLGVDVRILPLPVNVAAFGDTQLRGKGKTASALALLSNALTTPQFLRFLRRVRSEFHSLHPHLIHSNGLKSHIVSSLVAPAGVPLLWHVHDYYSQRPLVARVLRQFAQRVTGLIAISQDVERDITATLPGRPVTLLYNRVDTDRFSPGPGDGAFLDQLAGFSPASPGMLRVGLVATYANWKGHDVFIDAIARVPRNLPVRFYVVGGRIYSTDGSQFCKEELIERAARLDVLHRLGFVSFQSDPVQVYRSLDVMVHASTRPEPFGLTIAEAMACGTSTIVAASGGARELFTPGHDALGHPPGDSTALAEAITTLLTQPELRRTLTVHSRQTVLDRFAETTLQADVQRLFDRHLATRTATLSPSTTAPQHITFLNPIGGLGGAEQSLLRLMQILSRYEPQTRFTLLSGSDGPLLERAAGFGAEVVRFPFAESLSRVGESGLKSGMRPRLHMGLRMPVMMRDLWATLRWLNRWFKDHPTDLVHSNGLKTHLLTALCTPPSLPLIWHIRDFLGDRPLMSVNLRWLASRATMAVANSQAVATDARRVFDGLPVRVLANTVDTERFRLADVNPERLDEKAGIVPPPPGTVRIGIVSTYAHWKGHDVLLHALAQLQTANPWRLYIVGDPIYATPGSQFSRTELEALAEKLGIRDRIAFVPFQADTSRVYRKLDVVVHASIRPEPFGLTIAEAMSSGRATIVSAAGGALELFTDGIDALGHHPGDVYGLANALRRLIDDSALREQLGRAARASTLARFDEPQAARNLMNLYQECLSLHRRRS